MKLCIISRNHEIGSCAVLSKSYTSFASLRRFMAYINSSYTSRGYQVSESLFEIVCLLDGVPRMSFEVVEYHDNRG